MHKFWFIVLFLVGCSAPPRTDYSVSTNFADYASYRYVEQESAKTLDQDRIESVLNQRLPMKGLNADSENGQLYVVYRLEPESELQAFGSSVGFGYAGRGFGIAIRSPERYREIKFGRLVIEFIDADTNAMVWQSVSGSRLTESTKPEKRLAFFEKQIDTMLADYPPLSAP